MQYHLLSAAGSPAFQCPNQCSEAHASGPADVSLFSAQLRAACGDLISPVSVQLCADLGIEPVYPACMQLRADCGNSQASAQSQSRCVQIVGTAILWGGGTAIGEIPPYAFSYHAAKAGHQNNEFDQLFQVKPSSQAV